MVIKNPKDEKKIAFEGKNFPIHQETSTCFQVLESVITPVILRALNITNS
jgi:hypothetical protein